ncbi:hypothetical protein OUZ56_024082 [Daphnia magna]|uniref:Phorbol-ester/DAG-type domain-containing protein n=1 Tax=Daphnia magna TaxID=35525 RepID=A0ABR0B030_9CRUS|nr:hypothetical protein OUZ56_024082 [Daphnia magna]
MVFQMPAQVSSAVQNPELKLEEFRKLFDEDAWASVLQMVETKKQINTFHCHCKKESKKDDGGIQCHSCLLLCHRKCEKLSPGEVIRSQTATNGNGSYSIAIYGQRR